MAADGLAAPAGAASPTPGGLTELLEIQRDLAIGLLRCGDLPECLEVLLSTVLRLPGFDSGGVYRFDEATGGLRLTSHRGVSDAFVQRVSRFPADSLQARMVSAGAVVYALRSDLPAEVGEALTSEGLAAFALVPLRARGQTLGALTVSSRCCQQIQPESRIALESVVALAEGATELIEARVARLSTERKLRMAVEGADIGIWVADRDSRTFEASRRFRELHGLGPHEPLTIAAVQAAIHPADLASLMAAMRRTIEDGAAFSGEYRTRDGSRWIGTAARFYGDHGNQIYGTARDITSRKQEEESLRDSRDQLEARVAQRTAELAAANAALQEQSARLEMALDASQAGTWELDFATGKFRFDPRCSRIFGYDVGVRVTFEECLAQRVHPDDHVALLSHLEEILLPGTDDFWNQEFRLLHPTLGERWVLGLGQIERDAEGQPRRAAGLDLDITRRKWIEHELAQSEEKYRKLHQSMHDAFVRTDMAGRILEFNPAYQEMLGYTPAELARLTYNDLTPERWHAFEARLVETQILHRDYSEVYEKEYIRKDGTIVPVELRTFLIRDVAGQPASMWAIVRDVTERKATEAITRQWHQTLERRLGERAQQLQQSETRFRQLAESTFEGIIISEDGIVLDGNPQLAAMFGYELAEMIGRPLLDFVVPESRAKFAELLRNSHEGSYEWLCLRRDGTRFPVEANPRILTWQGRTVRVTALRDLTQIKQAAARILAQQTELDRAERLALISEISAGIIHQISQPISSVDSNLAVVMINLTACDLQRCNSLGILHEIQAEVTRMREIVIHLRSLANPEQPVRTRIDLNPLVAEVLPLLQREAGTRRIHLETDLAPDLPPLLADAVQLKQVVLNLVRNGFDACAECAPPRRVVAISTRALAGEELELCVRDAGIGIAPGIDERLFDLFFTTKKEGHGIGLRLCRTIVAAHDGSIEAGNNPDGIGAVFRVLLPADSPKPIPRYNSPTAADPATTPP